MKFIKYLLIFWLIFDIGSLYLLGHFTDGGYVLMELIATLILGAVLLSKNKMPNQKDPEAMMANMMNPGAMIKKIKFAVAAIMLIIPGLFTDVLALFILSPLSAALINRFNPMAQMANMMGGMNGAGAKGGAGGFGAGGFDPSMFSQFQQGAANKKPKTVDGNVIDGEFHREK
jgi:UPF0716 protein FxsA